MFLLFLVARRRMSLEFTLTLLFYLVVAVRRYSWCYDEKRHLRRLEVSRRCIEAMCTGDSKVIVMGEESDILRFLLVQLPLIWYILPLYSEFFISPDKKFYWRCWTLWDSELQSVPFEMTSISNMPGWCLRCRICHFMFSCSTRFYDSKPFPNFLLCCCAMIMHYGIMTVGMMAHDILHAKNCRLCELQKSPMMQ